MKIPILGSSVLYVPLADEAAQGFVAAGEAPLGEAVVAPVPYPAGYRAATVIGVSGERATLLVYKLPGDPFRGDADELCQQVGAVAYDAAGGPGTWMEYADAQDLAAA